MKKKIEKLQIEKPANNITTQDIIVQEIIVLAKKLNEVIEVVNKLNEK